MAQIDLTKLADEFTKAYREYYDSWDTGDYKEMYEKGCKLIDDKNMVPLLSAFARYRQDYITSDREVAAFAKAYTKLTSAKHEDVKIYSIQVDDFTAQLILTALMEKAHQKGISQEAKSNYLQAYGDIKESLTAQ